MPSRPSAALDPRNVKSEYRQSLALAEQYRSWQAQAYLECRDRTLDEIARQTIPGGQSSAQNALPNKAAEETSTLSRHSHVHEPWAGRPTACFPTPAAPADARVPSLL